MSKSTSKSDSWRKKYFMMSKIRSWRKRYVMMSKSMSWCQNYNRTPKSHHIQKYVMCIKVIKSMSHASKLSKVCHDINVIQKVCHDINVIKSMSWHQCYQKYVMCINVIKITSWHQKGHQSYIMTLKVCQKLRHDIKKFSGSQKCFMTSKS